MRVTLLSNVVVSPTDVYVCPVVICCRDAILLVLIGTCCKSDEISTPSKYIMSVETCDDVIVVELILSASISTKPFI